MPAESAERKCGCNPHNSNSCNLIGGEMNWQPIETAPKDGTVIWAYCPDGISYYRGDSYDDPESPEGLVLLFWRRHQDIQSGYRGGWCFANYDARGVVLASEAKAPTHWAPLLPPSV